MSSESISIIGAGAETVSGLADLMRGTMGREDSDTGFFLAEIE
jgi:hypothetical protein